MKHRIALGAVTILSLALIASLAGIVRGGPLDPAGAPAPTYRTLGDVPPSWHQALDASGGCLSERFTCVLGGLAVLDNETGLVWDKVPDGPATWANAVDACYTATIAGRGGWRLPAIEELRSLVDPTAPAPPKVPVGHPFSEPDIIDSSIDFYWTQTSSNANTANAYVVSFFNGNASTKAKTESHYRWCVRGGTAHDAW